MKNKPRTPYRQSNKQANPDMDYVTKIVNGKENMDADRFINSLESINRNKRDIRDNAQWNILRKALFNTEVSDDFYEQSSSSSLSKYVQVSVSLFRRDLKAKNKEFDLNKIGEVLRVKLETGEMKIMELADLLNDLSQVELGQEDVRIDPRQLGAEIERRLPNSDPRDIANIVNGLSEIGYKKDDLGIDPELMAAVINHNLPEARIMAISNTIKGLVRIGFNKDNLSIDTDLLHHEIINKIDEKDGLAIITDVLHGLAGFESKETATEICHQIKPFINRALRNEKSCQKISRNLNILTDLGITKKDSFIDQESLFKAVTQSLKNPRLSVKIAEIYVLLNSLNKNGYREADFTVDFSHSLADKINNVLHEASSMDIANIFNSLAQIGCSKDNVRIAPAQVGQAVNRTLDQAKLIGIANSFNGLGQMGFKKGDVDIESGKLSQAINKNLDDVDSIGIANMLNGFSQMGFQKDDLEINLNALSKAINRTLQEAESIGIANTFNGLAQMGLKKDELTIDSVKLSETINRTLQEAELIGIANTFNGFAQMGLKKDELTIDSVKLSEAINRTLQEAEFIGIANTFNGLLNFRFIDKDFLHNIDAPYSFPEKVTVTEMSANSIARFDFYCQKVLDFKFLGDGFMNELYSQYHANNLCENREQNHESNSQKRLAESLRKKGYEITCEVDEDYNGIPILSTDIIAKLGDKSVYIEYDGPFHFDKNHEYDGRTLVRNEMYEALMREKGDQNAFLSIPYYISQQEQLQMVIDKFNDVSPSIKEGEKPMTPSKYPNAHANKSSKLQVKALQK